MSGLSTDSRRFRVHCNRVAIGASALGGVFATEICVCCSRLCHEDRCWHYLVLLLQQTFDPPINMTLDPCPILVSFINCASSFKIAVYMMRPDMIQCRCCCCLSIIPPLTINFMNCGSTFVSCWHFDFTSDTVTVSNSSWESSISNLLAPHFISKDIMV